MEYNLYFEIININGNSNKYTFNNFTLDNIKLDYIDNVFIITFDSLILGIIDKQEIYSDLLTDIENIEQILRFKNYIKKNITNISKDNFNVCIKLRISTLKSINEDFKYAIMYKNKSKLTINYKILDSICFSSNINYLNLTFGYDDIFSINSSNFTTTCIQIKIISLPTNLKYIHCNFFNNFINLKKIKMNNSIISISKCFLNNCKSLEEIKLSNSLKIIKYGFCNYCTNLKKIILPNSLCSIGNKFLHNCYNLEEIILPNSLKIIGSSFLCNCTSLRKIIFPDSLEQIGTSCLYNCSNLSEITLSNSLKIIQCCFLYNCTNLKKILLPNSIEIIKYRFLESCTSLEEITLSNSLKIIRSKFLINCNSLKLINIPQTRSLKTKNLLIKILSFKFINLITYL